MKIINIKYATRKLTNKEWLDTHKNFRKHSLPRPSIEEDGKGYARNPIADEINIPTIDELKHEAEIAAQIRGHTLDKWEDFIANNRNYSKNICLVCHKTIQVCSNPLPNEIDVSGEAAALNCS
jgi:hypothetical protein